MPHLPEPQPCRSCRAMIYQVKGPAGRYIPVQKVRTVYVLDQPLAGLEPEPEAELVRFRVGEQFVSHFELCPDASQHSKRTG